LNCVGTVNDLSQQQVHLLEGLKLGLYAADVDANGRESRLIAEGTVTYSADENCWVAVIDWNQIRHEPGTSNLGQPAEDLPATTVSSRPGNGAGAPPHQPAGR